MTTQHADNQLRRSAVPTGLESMTCELKEGVVRIVVATGRDANRMTTGTYEELHTCLRWAGSQRGARVVVLTGEPDFSAGGDWELHRVRDRQNFRDHLLLLFDISVAMRTMGPPIIAAVRGRCTGGMHQVSLLADLTLASDDAVFGQHGCRTGSWPIFWGTQLLPRIVGEKKAREIVYMSWEYSATEALQIGLCNRVVPKEELGEEVGRWCERIKLASPRSLRFAKTSLNVGSDLNWAGIWQARDALAEFAGSEEWNEAIDSYLEEREPQWVSEGPIF